MMNYGNDMFYRFETLTPTYIIKINFYLFKMKLWWVKYESFQIPNKIDQ